MSTIDEQMGALVQQQMKLRGELAELVKHRPREAVEDYELQTTDGPVRLSDLFGDHRDMLLVHNMGRGCAYCTMWADGLQGLAHHIATRAALVVVSPDAPDVQAAFAESRGWSFQMASQAGSSLAADLGFAQDGAVWPGVSALHLREDGGIERVAKQFFGPGDVYNAAFHLFDLLDGGVGSFAPRLSYA